MSETVTEQATAAADRAAIRAEIVATQAAYRELVGRIGDARWGLRSGNPAWTCGQLAWHMATGAGFIAGMIEGARKGKALNPPSFLMPLIYKASELRVKIASRKATPESVLADFDAGIARTLATLDGMAESELALSVTAMGEERTLAQLFRMTTEHVAEHAPEIRTAIGGA
jgi:uncharacterized protein (TIGR03083 family)